MVALECDAYDVISEAEGEEDLGGRREQGHDPHGTEATGRLRPTPEGPVVGARRWTILVAASAMTAQ
jgi:hypothetical protein